MDPLAILFPVRPDTRRTVCALRDMGIRAVIAEDGLRLVSCDAPKPSGDTEHLPAARFQPRDDRGRFVAYWVLSLEIETDLCDAGEHYESDEWLGGQPDPF